MLLSSLSGHEKFTGLDDFSCKMKFPLLTVCKIQVETVPVISCSLVTKIVTGPRQAVVACGLILFISDIGRKARFSHSEQCPDSTAPLCSNSQGVETSSSRRNFTLEGLYDDKLIDSCDLGLCIVVSVMATTAPESDDLYNCSNDNARTGTRLFEVKGTRIPVFNAAWHENLCEDVAAVAAAASSGTSVRWSGAYAP